MVKKICPICDQVMKSGHFCRNCRSWIKHPYEREMNYYLNERHPVNEAQCDYHGQNQPHSAGTASHEGIYADSDLNRQLNRQAARPGGQAAGNGNGAGGRPGSGGSTMAGGRQGSGGSTMAGGVSGSGKTAMPARGAGPSGPGMSGAAGERQNTYGMPNGGYGQGSSGNGPQVTAKLVKSGKGAYIIVAVAVGIVLLIAVGTTMLGGLYDAISQNLSDNLPYSDSYYGDADEWSDENYRELDDEEVKAAGVRCNTYYHFLTKEEALAPAVSEAILSAGYKIASETTYSYNDATLDGEDEWTYYSTSHTIYVAGDGMTIRDDLSQWVEMDSDTATGELHSYSSQLADNTKSLMIMTEFVKGIESNYGIKTGESCIPEITRDMPAGLDSSGIYFYESDLFYISAETYSDGLYLQVSCNQAD